MIKINPYLGFHNNARQAMEFYKSVFGGELTLSTYGENDAKDNPAENIMHAQLIVGPEMTLMASDMSASNDRSDRMNISLTGEHDDDQTLRTYWQKLSEGATITMPLQTAPWGDAFGMLTDQFGVDWMINIAAAKA